MTCKIKNKKYHNIPIIRIIGNLTGKDAPEVMKRIESLSKKKYEKIIIALDETELVDSCGLGIFIHSWKMLKDQNCELLFLNPNEFIYNIIANSNLHKHFKIINSLELV